MNISQLILHTAKAVRPKQPRDKSRTVARYKQATSGEFCARDAATALKIRRETANETLQRLANDGLLNRTKVKSLGHGKHSQFYRWPKE